MSKPKTRPSPTSLVAFFLIVAPVVYVLSYAPVVRVCGRTVEYDPDIPFPSGTFNVDIPDYQSGVTLENPSLYPAYQPVHWLIDHTPLREPLMLWADLWGVRYAFEVSEIERFLLDRSRASSTGR